MKTTADTLAFDLDLSSPEIVEDRAPRVRGSIVHPKGGPEVMGVAPGDIATTDYGTGPYIIHVSSLRWEADSLCGYLHVSREPLLMTYGYDESGHIGILNRIWIDAAGNYRSGMCWQPPGILVPNTIYFERTGIRMPTLETPTPSGERYKFQGGVDYDAVMGCVWKCAYGGGRCRIDFNTEEPYLYNNDWQKGNRPICPRCGRSENLQFEMVLLAGGKLNP